MESKNKIRVAFVGFGYWSPILLRNFQKFREFEIVAVCDKDESRHPAILKALPNAKVYLHYKEAFQDPNIDAVVIVTNPSSHFRIANEALQQGKHVLVEKPLAMSVHESEKLVKLAAHKKKVLMIDHTYIYSPAIQELKNVIRAGELGKLYSYDSTRINLGLFQRDNSVVWDLAAHDFSILLYLVNETPTHVYALGLNPIRHPRHKESFESIAYINVFFKSGLMAHFHISWLAPIKTRRLMVVGSKQMAVYDQYDPEGKLKIYDQGVVPKDTEEKFAAMFEYRVGNLSIPALPSGEDLEFVAKDFLRSIQGDTKPIVDGYFGLQVVRLLEAAEKSMRQGGKKIWL